MQYCKHIHHLKYKKSFTILVYNNLYGVFIEQCVCTIYRFICELTCSTKQSIDLIKLNFQTTSLEPPFYTPWFDGPKSTVQRAQKGVHSKEDAICEWWSVGRAWSCYNVEIEAKTTKTGRRVLLRKLESAGQRSFGRFKFTVDVRRRAGPVGCDAGQTTAHKWQT